MPDPCCPRCGGATDRSHAGSLRCRECGFIPNHDGSMKRPMMLLPLLLAVLIAAAAVRTAQRPRSPTPAVPPVSRPTAPPAPTPARSLPPTTCAGGHACAQATADPAPHREHWFQRGELRTAAGAVLWHGRWTRTSAEAAAELSRQVWPDGAAAAHVGRRFYS
ncbi:MAG: hypothetical protein JWM27_4717 [Gemmatimonadetes bacterium]|nr:hypothetical protein [Gemmatimonadota bacterium]